MHLQYFPPLAFLTFFFLSINALPLSNAASTPDLEPSPSANLSPRAYYKASLAGAFGGLSSVPQRTPHNNNNNNNPTLISPGIILQLDLQPFVDAISSAASSDTDYEPSKQKPTTISTCASSSDISKEDILNWLKATAETQWTQELLSWQVSIVPRERLKVAWRAVAKRLGWAC